MLQPNEILTHVILPRAGRGQERDLRSAVQAVARLAAGVGSVALSMNGQTIRGARIVMGAVAPVPWRSPAAEAALAGKRLSEATATDAADAAVRGRSR